MSFDVRAFLRSEGFTVGERGRFSADMIAAVEAKHPGLLTAGKVAKAPKVPKAPKPPKVPKVPKVSLVKPVPKGDTATPLPRGARAIVRQDSVLYAISPVGRTHVRIGYSACQSCAYSVQTCQCKSGPKPPAGAIPVPTFPRA